MSWLEDTHLRDLDEDTAVEATCLACLHVWILTPTQLLLRVDHRDVRLDTRRGGRQSRLPATGLPPRRRPADAPA